MHERSVTGVVLSLRAAISPMLASVLVENRASTSLSFFLPGGIKMVYDLLSLVSNARGQTRPPTDPHAGVVSLGHWPQAGQF
jgi:hypothetical protein